ncbi:MAG: glycosyltransferase [Lachnospiraceae bacterium]|nr:glycosyltransferase [Lachnospiraceae bacterium]
MNSMITIVIISHNQEDIISACVESAIHQSFSDIEIICVDEGSTDSTVSILRSYEEKDPRIHVIEQEAGIGLNNARRTGIEASTGRFLLLVDGDDSLEPEACETLCQEMLAEPVDILQFGVNVIPTANASAYTVDANKRLLNTMPDRLEGKEIFRKCFIEQLYSSSIWGKMYAASLLQNAYTHMEHTPLYMAEDKYQYFVISYYAKTYRSIDRPLYNYTVGSGMSTLPSGDLHAFNLICTKKNATDTTRRFADLTGDSELQDAAKELSRDELKNCIQRADTWLTAPFSEGIEVTLRYYDPASIVAEMAQMYHGHPAKIVTDFRNSSCITPKENARIFTIGAYYHRIFSGGAERVLCHLIHLWCQMGYRVILFTEAPPCTDDYDLPESVVRVILPHISSQNDPQLYERMRKIQSAIQEYAIDLMMDHQWTDPFLLWDLLVCKMNHIRFVIQCCSVFSQPAIGDPKRHLALPYVFSMADGLITLNHMDTEFWKNFNPCIFETVNPMEFQSVEEIVPSDLESKTVIWCQRISGEKNPEEALQIFKRVLIEVPSAKLFVVGRGETEEMLEALKEYALSIGLSDSVLFAGYQKDVFSYYRQSSVCMITSDYEGFPNGLVESMGAGVPVVMYDLPYLTMIEKGKGIRTVKKHDLDGMAKQVIHLLLNEQERKKLGSEAREAVADVLRYDFCKEWAVFFSQLENQQPVENRFPLMWEVLLEHYNEGIERIRQKLTRTENQLDHARQNREKALIWLQETKEAKARIETEYRRKKEMWQQENLRLKNVKEQLLSKYDKLMDKNRKSLDRIASLEKRCAGLEETSFTQNASIDRLQYELLATRTSFSTRLGLAFTWLPRQVLHIGGLRKKDGRPQKKGYHILLISHELTYSGAPAALLRMARSLIALKYPVDVWSLSDGEYRKEFESAGIPVRIMPYPDCSTAEMLLALQPYQLVIANTIFCAPIANLAKQYVPTVLFLREAMNLPDLLTKNFIPREVIEQADRIACVSEYARSFIESTYHPANITVLQDYVEDEYDSIDTKAASTVHTRIRFLISGTLEQRKGQAFALETFLSLPEPLRSRAELHMIGRKPQWSKEYWSNLPLDVDGIYEHEEITDRIRLLQFYSSMDVVLIPSTDESLSLVALEAAMLGKAVILSDHVGAMSLFSREDIFPVGNRDALRSMMESYIKDPEKYIADGKKNRESYLLHASEKVYLSNLSQWINRQKSENAADTKTSVREILPQASIIVPEPPTASPQQPLISVVIPVYNAEPYIPSCVAMLKQQTYTNYEILFIDDQSIDDTPDRITRAAAGDSRFRVLPLSKKGGAGAARNRGIDEAHGKYIIFLDVDDEYHPCLLEKASARLEKTKADLVTYDFWRIYADGKEKERVGIYRHGKSMPKDLFNYSDYPDRIMSIINPTPWNKMYSLAFIREKNLRFEELASTNDITFAAVSVVAASKITYIQDVLYGYHIANSGSITESKKADCNSLVSAVLSAKHQVEQLSYYCVIQKSAEKFVVDNLLYGFDHYIEDWSSPSARQYYESVREVFLSGQYEEEDLSSVTDRNRQLCYAIKERPYEEYLRLSGHRLIVSLTSYPQRITAVPTVVDALLHQTHPADEIILWLSKEEFPEKEKNLPKELLELQNHPSFRVEWVSENLKSHKKYFYAFRKYPDSIVITVDDDLYFPEDLIDHLFISYLRFPSAVSARRVHLIAYETSGKIYPYELWPRETDVCIHESRHQLLATGGAGALYPPGLLDLTLLDETLIREYSLDADDLWLKVMEIANHIPVVLTDTNHPLQYIKDTQSTALAKKNVDLNQNDLYLSRIRDWYDAQHGSGAFVGLLSDNGQPDQDSMQEVLYHYRQLLTRKKKEVSD